MKFAVQPGIPCHDVAMGVSRDQCVFMRKQAVRNYLLLQFVHTVAVIPVRLGGALSGIFSEDFSGGNVPEEHFSREKSAR